LDSSESCLSKKIALAARLDAEILDSIASGMLAIMRKRIFLNRGCLARPIENPPAGHLRVVRGSAPVDVVIGREALSVTLEVELIDWRLCRWRMMDIPLLTSTDADKRIAEAFILEMHRSRTPSSFKAAPHQPLRRHLPLCRGFRVRFHASCGNSGSGARRGPAAHVCLL
jgi:hypothetical protein